MSSLIDLLDKNSDRRPDRLQRYNFTLDAVKVEELQGYAPNLNLSLFFRDVIDQVLHEIETQGWIKYSLEKLDEVEEVKKKNGKA